MSDNQAPTGNWQSGTSAPVFNAPWSVLAVIGVLAAVHAGLYLAGDQWQIIALELLSIIPSRFTNPARLVLDGSQYWSLITYMLLHGDWMHLLFNSLWLLVFGTPVARYLGSLRFILLALAAGIVGGLSSLALHWGEDIFVIGASGAVSGLLAAAIPIMYGHRVPGGARPLTFGELISSSMRRSCSPRSGSVSRSFLVPAAGPGIPLPLTAALPGKPISVVSSAALQRFTPWRRDACATPETVLGSLR